eukprot:scaffold23168_cov125-Isochrysis_galbana.AAC.5
MPGGGLGALKALHTSGDSAETLCPLPSGHSPSPFPFIPHPFSLFRPPFAEGWCPSCELPRALQQPGLEY